RNKHPVEPVLDFGFYGHSDVKQKVGVTVNQPGQQCCAAEINCLDAGRRISFQSRGRADFLDLPVFDQNGRGRKHISSTRVEQPAGSYESHGSRRFGHELRVGRKSDKQCRQQSEHFAHTTSPPSHITCSRSASKSSTANPNYVQKCVKPCLNCGEPV